MMKNRFKVIEGRDQYQKYKTIDQAKRIEKHEKVHERIAKERAGLREEMRRLGETREVRERN